MSHINAGEVVIKSVPALRAAAEEMGCKLVEKKTYNWFGQSVGDYPLPAGMKEKDLGKCDFAIQVPGVTYEVGVVRQKDGGYTLAYDFYGNGLYKHGKIPGGFHDGEKLLKKFGDKLCGLQQSYNKHAVLAKAKANGFLVRQLPATGGAIKYQLVKV